MSAQKTLIGNVKEMRELLVVMKEKSISSTRGVIYSPSRQIKDFFTKKETEKIELVARPVKNTDITPSPYTPTSIGLHLVVNSITLELEKDPSLTPT